MLEMQPSLARPGERLRNSVDACRTVASFRGRRLLPLFLLAISQAASATVPRFVVEAADPELKALGQQAATLCEEWFPKINQILWGGNPPEMPAEVRILFDSKDVPAYTDGNAIHLSATEAKRPSKLDYRAVVIHELVHIVQRYPVPPRCDGMRIAGCFLAGRHWAPTWLGEGIADYITYTLYTGTNRPYLQIDGNGILNGYDESLPYLYGLQRSKVPVNAAFPPRGIAAKKGYQHGYTVTSAFLLWLEKHKDPHIVRKLNIAIHSRSYRSGIWRKHCRTSLDPLWDEFLRYSASQSKQ